MEATDRRLSHLIVLLGSAALGVSACKRDRPTPQPADVTASAASARATPTRKPQAAESVRIPGGTFRAGSTPGEAGREPDLEPRQHAIELGPYEIDRLPYPNNPEQPALTNVPRDRAKQLCAERGRRLCTELEWERACKGPDSSPYASGTSFEPACTRTPLQCASGFDVLAMGTIREWTASNRDSGDGSDRAVARGAPADAAASAHRCAARFIVDGDRADPAVGFRCCGGAPNAARIKEPKGGTTFEKTKLSAERLAELLGGDPSTRELTKDVKFFREPEAANTVLSRGPGETKGFSLTVAPLLWQPIPGAEYLLVAARSGENTSFVVAYYALGEGQYRLASSFVMKNEPGPVALAYTNDIKPRLHFSSCWGCPGETGKILHRRPDQVVILQP